ncbi:MAG: CPBP family intramembrane metalloprotease [Proteobacteria bacterium]|nr:CPBP family intramembrane metalloprotease [Pseudomonadota bacterium]
MGKASARSRRGLAVEVSVTTAAVLAIVHLLYATRGNSFIGPKIAYIVAYLLLGAPLIVLWRRRRPLDFFSIASKDLVSSLKAFAVASVVLFPPFLVAAHFWQTIVGGHSGFSPAGFPGFINMMLMQLVLVALPEEFYFRGYFQSAMNAVFLKRWRFLGIDLGWGFFITAAVFAVAHTMITYRWWHFSIFFPALVFGWLRERTNNIVAPTLFHAASNLLMDWFVRSYV